MQDFSSFIKVKNKAPAPIQVSAEQLLREASDLLDPHASGAVQRIRKAADIHDNADSRQKNREFFENKLRRDRSNTTMWIRYAAYECGIEETARARSIFERALDVDPYCIPVYLRYTEMEMRGGRIGMARNLWNRAVSLQPRVDVFWLKYAHMEETLGDIDKARQVWSRWLDWQPPNDEPWTSAAKFERRYKNWAGVRSVYERMIKARPFSIQPLLLLARFEEQDLKNISRARSVYERICDTFETNTNSLQGNIVNNVDVDLKLKQSSEQALLRLPSNPSQQTVDHINCQNLMENGSNQKDTLQPSFFVEFARFETRAGEIDRARIIYRYAMQLFSTSNSLASQSGLHNSYATFERQHGDGAIIALAKRRALYENILRESPHNYDAWFSLIALECEDNTTESADTIRETYERAIANVPPSKLEKRHWRRYIYLWIGYAIYEECVQRDIKRACAIYRGLLDIIPHQNFTFAKAWILKAKFHIRQRDLQAARLTLGRAIGQCPKPKIFRAYIEIETNLREFDRARMIYTKQLLYDPADSQTWVRFAELERLLLDDDRARAIMEAAVSQEVDMPEIIWMSWIEAEYELGNFEFCRTLYRRLIDRSPHPKIMLAYSNFESSLADSKND